MYVSVLKWGYIGYSSTGDDCIFSQLIRMWRSLARRWATPKSTRTSTTSLLDKARRLPLFGMNKFTKEKGFEYKTTEAASLDKAVSD